MKHNLFGNGKERKNIETICPVGSISIELQHLLFRKQKQKKKRFVSNQKYRPNTKKNVQSLTFYRFCSPSIIVQKKKKTSQVQFAWVHFFFAMKHNITFEMLYWMDSWERIQTNNNKYYRNVKIYYCSDGYSFCFCCCCWCCFDSAASSVSIR